MFVEPQKLDGKRVLIVAAAFGYLWKLRRDIEQLQRVRSYVNLRMT